MPIVDILINSAGQVRFHIVDQSVLPLDWGILTPLWFLGHSQNMRGHGDVLADPPQTDIGPPAVIVTPSRSLPRETLVDFGQAVAEAAANDRRRIAFIASCGEPWKDWDLTCSCGTDAPSLSRVS